MLKKACYSINNELFFTNPNPETPDNPTQNYLKL